MCVKKFFHKKTLLVEIGTEDLPYKNLCLISKRFSKNFEDRLKKNYFKFETIYSYVSLRRLAIKVVDLSFETRNIHLIKDVKEGNVCSKKSSFRRGLNDFEKIVHKDHHDRKKDEYLFVQQYLNITLIRMVEFSLKGLSSFGFMRWENGNIKSHFIRPIRSVTILLEKFLVGQGISIFGINIDRKIFGNRSYSMKRNVLLRSSHQYPHILHRFGYVIPDYKMRKSIIRKKIGIFIEKLQGSVKLFHRILDEITAMVEWPNLLQASFERKFLSLPSDIVLHIVQTVHKYILIYDKYGRLTTKFIFVCDVSSLKNKNKIISDNQKVINSRLEDILFIFNEDRKCSLKSYLPKTKKISFCEGLGTIYEKIERLVSLSKWISGEIKMNQKELLLRASLLSKCDLATSMVKYYPEIQGIVGKCYSHLDSEIEDVSESIEEQYYPRFSKDRLPNSKIGDILSISDNIDSIVGMFGIGKRYHGKKDPFFLRRMSVAVLRIIIEKGYNIDLLETVKLSLDLYKNNNFFRVDGVLEDINSFFIKRIRYLYQQNGYDIKMVDSICLNSIKDIRDFDLKIRALRLFKLNRKSSDVVRINKRILRIINKFTFDHKKDIDLLLLKSPQEINLVKVFHLVSKKVNELCRKRLYFEAIVKMYDLVDPVDRFFEHVMIIDKNHIVMENRLIILNDIKSLFLKISDFSFS
ncbi:glycine--tRNA ligase subunit beta [Candidatus Riesia pediculischaeffi]|uniref:Glycine--tRNA ligase beta subunit n=1 Tax=Candidatus Riesia pediculischaeffi TaxID=428411 RepID=A0A1V0HJW0_9ENTR|nr:glycine--tRNA ligase subunit beta [Candidatus Riesia pediculischaeffi]ARC53113.1 hypothetical protein AOQ87_00095 [Candidatus Riesia pediculischaeffi]